MRRRTLLFAAAAAPQLAGPAAAASPPALRVFRAPGCTCCEAWAAHMRAAGFAAAVAEDGGALEALRRGLGVPEDLAACHLGVLGPHAFEGHVPAAAVRRFLAAPGGWRGLSVPGMPAGSPGMEAPGAAAEAYAVVAFGPAGRDPAWARARGAALL